MMKKIQGPCRPLARTISMIPTLFILLLTIIFGVVFSCTSTKEKSFNIIKLSGDGSFLNLSTTGIASTVMADSLTPTAMVVRAGDLLAHEDWYLYYRDPKTQGYDFSYKNGVCFNNCNIFSLKLSSKILDQNGSFNPDSLDLTQLESIVIEKEFRVEDLGYLKKLADKKPNVGIIIEGNQEISIEILNLFKPIWVVLTDVSREVLTNLPSMNELELLAFTPSDSLIDYSLPAFPKLKHLILTEIKENALIDARFLENNTQIESLICSNCELSDFSFAKPLSHLKTFGVLSFKQTIDVGFLEGMQSLSRLIILGNNISNWESISLLPRLKWLSLSGNISQKNFESMISRQKGLEVVELIDCDSIKNLEAIVELKKIKALTVADSLTDRANLLQLNNLSYLSLPIEVLKDSVYLQELQKTMPDCVIVPNDGFCMGSGWLLLFFPLVVAAMCVKFVLQGKFSKKGA
jgi:hypothetical protein